MINKIAIAILSYFLIFGQSASLAQSTAAILPQGITQFLDNNGNPLSSGKVYFYIPSTTTFKTTWQDSAKSVANANPVILDTGGRAIIYGNGTYRQQVHKSNNDLVYDVVTASAGTGSGTTGTGDGDLVGTVKPWAGLVAPNQYAFSYGQEISRTTYSVLFTALTLSQNINCTSASPILTGMSDTSQIPVGAVIETNCAAAGSTVLSKTTTTVTLNNNATLTTATTAVFFLYGNGNGSTTFNLPDLRGYVVAGRNNMGGTASTRLTIAGLGETADATGAAGGNQTKTLLTGNLPAYTPAGTIVSSVTDPGHIHQINIVSRNNSPIGGASVVVDNINTPPGAGIGLATSSSTTGITVASTFTGTAQGGASTPISIVQPTITLNYIIKITPDSNSADANGVTSLGGMVGDIACGSGLLCTGNIISASTNSLPQGNLFVGNSLNIATATTPAQLGSLYAEAYGVVCDGATNNGDALQTVLNSASTLGVKVILPGGNCIIEKQINLPLNANLEGSGTTQTSLYLSSTTATLFNIAVVGSTVNMSNFRILPTTTRTSTSIIFNATVSSDIHLNHLQALFTGVFLATTHSLVQFDINQVTISASVLNSVIYDITGCYICTIRNSQAFHDAAGRPFANFVLRDLTGQMQIINSHFGTAQYDIYAIPGNGQVVTLVKTEASYFDSAGTSNIFIKPTGNGLVQRLMFTTGWVSGSGGILVDMQGGVDGIYSFGAITGGSLYTNGTYSGVALTGGAGTGATANITVSGGAVTAVTLVNAGARYVVGNTLSVNAASIGGTGSGFSIPVGVIRSTIDEILFDGVEIIGSATTPNGISASGVSRLSVLNSWISGSGGTLTTGISLINSDSCDIRGNYVLGLVTTGISLTGTTTKCRIGPNDLSGATTKITDTTGLDNPILPGNTGAYSAAGTVYIGRGAATSELFSAAPVLGASGTLGSLTFGNATSGTLKIQPVAGALGTTTTLIPVNDTLVGKATTDTFTNKTYDTAGTGNSFSINSVAVTANTGTGAVARAASPTFTGTVTIPTPFTLGAISVTSTGTQLNYLNAATGTTGTTSTNVVFSTSPTLTTPNIGVASGTSVDISGAYKIGAVDKLSVSGDYTLLKSNANQGIVVGNVDTTNFYDNNTHTVRNSGGGTTFATITSTGISTPQNITFSAATKTIVLKQGANGAVGTFVCTSGGTITINNTNVAITDIIPISLNTVGGTISTNPTVNAITAATSFTVKCATSDTSTYNYALIKNAA